jgi:ATP-binding cassette, subfamily B, multidrug efflux pump
MPAAAPSKTSPPLIPPDSIKTNILWRCYRYLRPYRQTAAGAYLTLVGALGINILIPQLIRAIIDQGIAGGDRRLLAAAVTSLLGLALVKGLLTYLQGMWSETASQNVAFDLRNEIQRKLTLLSFSYHDRVETGELLSRAIQDVERIRFLTGRATLRIIEAVLMLVGTAGMLLWMNATLAWLVILTMPFLVQRALAFGRRYRPLSQRIQEQLAQLTMRVEQAIRGSQVVKAFAQEEAEIERFDQANESWFDLSAYAGRLQAVNIPLLFLIANIGSVFIVWFGGRQVIQGSLTLGELVAFIAYLGQLVDPVRRLGMIIPAVAMAGSSAERVFEILDSISEVNEKPGAVELPPLQGRVEFEDVSFGYSRRTILHRITLIARPGEVIALLGQTGSGKSSLVNLVPRFYDPSSGRVTVDGYDVRAVTIHSLRSQIGIVLQESVLFAGTIRENLVFGRPDCPEEEMIAAAEAAQIHDWIIQMPEGYSTAVGERGATLSGGQKQRLAIARALLMNPRILILDDALASVDADTERKIQIALAHLMRGRTTFVIAHRVSTLKVADQILVLEKGRIAASGVHESLMRDSRLYREIYRQQMRSQAGKDDTSSEISWSDLDSGSPGRSNE